MVRAGEEEVKPLDCWIVYASSCASGREVRKPMSWTRTRSQVDINVASMRRYRPYRRARSQRANRRTLKEIRRAVTVNLTHGTGPLTDRCLHLPAARKCTQPQIIVIEHDHDGLVQQTRANIRPA